MQREILFRSWNIIDKCFYYFENGTYYYFGERGSKIIVEEFVFNWENTQQFTGILDKNGVKIFEGDLLEDNYNDEGIEIEGFAEVVFDIKKAEWAIDNSFKQDKSSFTSLVGYLGDELKVIGNIHDE